MRPIVLPTIACLFCLCAALPADDQPADDAATAATEVLVYPVRDTPPEQIVDALRSLYGEEAGLRITAAPGGKTLLLRVDPKLKDDVLSLLENIDPPANRLAIQVALIHRLPNAEPTDVNSLSGPAEAVWNAVRGLEQRGQVSVSDRIQLTALENQQTTVNFGQQRPVVTGVSNTGRGTTAAMYRQQNTGTLLTCRGRSTPDGEVTLEIQFEKSEIVELPETPIQEGVAASGTDTTVVRSTVSLRSGTATLLSAAGSDDERRQDSYLVLTATVLQPGQDHVAGMFDRGRQPDRMGATGFRTGGPSGGFGGRSSAAAVSSQIGRLAEATFQRLDRNQDGILQADELPAYLDGNSDSEWNLDAVRQWFLENPSTALRFSTFGADSSRTPDTAARSRFGAASRGGFGGSSGSGFSRASRGGFSSGGFRPPRRGLLGTLLRDDVSQVLELSEEQRSQAEELARNDRSSSSDLFARSSNLFERMRNASGEEREQVVEEIAELRRKQEEETDRQIAEILSNEEMSRLKQLDLQYNGFRALLRDDVADALHLTDEQKSRFQALSDEDSQRQRELGFRAYAEQRAELERQQNEEFFTVLSDEQRQAWLEMVGKVVVDNGTPRN